MNFFKPISAYTFASSVNSFASSKNHCKPNSGEIFPKINKAGSGSGSSLIKKSLSCSDLDSVYKHSVSEPKKIHKLLSFETIQELINITSEAKSDCCVYSKYREETSYITFKSTSITKEGRKNKQNRLMQLMNDDKVASCDRGWLRQDYNQIQRGTRKTIRVPPGKDLAHWRGFEAAKGYDYFHASLQDTKLHQLQHKFDGFGKKNCDRGPNGKNKSINNNMGLI